MDPRVRVDLQKPHSNLKGRALVLNVGLFEDPMRDFHTR
jgi:hypothetical protein